MVKVIAGFAILAVLLLVPLLLVAIALGPVILGVLCAAGFGLLVFMGVNFVIGLGMVGRAIERAGVRRLRHR